MPELLVQKKLTKKWKNENSSSLFLKNKRKCGCCFSWGIATTLLLSFQVSAILGACVADAAARPLHWVYDMSDLKKYLNQKVGSTPEEKSVDRNKFPEFYPESKSPFYNVSSENWKQLDAKSEIVQISNTVSVQNPDVRISAFLTSVRL